MAKKGRANAALFPDLVSEGSVGSGDEDPDNDSSGSSSCSGDDDEDLCDVDEEVEEEHDDDGAEDEDADADGSADDDDESEGAAGEDEFGAAAGKGYKGATVIDAQKGMYFGPICVCDFASLYPSIMIAFNMSYETLLVNGAADQKKYHLRDDQVTKIELGTGRYVFFVKREVAGQRGFLPTILIQLLEVQVCCDRVFVREKRSIVACVLESFSCSSCTIRCLRC